MIQEHEAIENVFAFSFDCGKLNSALLILNMNG